ncbi:MAG: hypothetical protein PHV32_07025 [Eubacteriales bacterium]|nr:hypothetical protein [Eubacteriales bacterium]
MNEANKNAAYIYVTMILKKLLASGKITEMQYRKIDSYNAEYYGASVVIL